MPEDTALNPAHYQGKNGVQAITLVRFLPFSMGNALKYVYRNEQKENAVQDLGKALWYLEDFTKHPLVLEKKGLWKTHAEEVLASCGPWEEVACRLLLRVYEASEAGGEGFSQAVSEAWDLISTRRKLLLKEQAKALG